jgi:biotin operon repressor
MAISNQIFETYRSQQRVVERNKAIAFLRKEGYTIFDVKKDILSLTQKETY